MTLPSFRLLGQIPPFYRSLFVYFHDCISTCEKRISLDLKTFDINESIYTDVISVPNRLISPSFTLILICLYTRSYGDFERESEYF